ncbi:hypothetical protein [Sphingopyxis sp. RIFCSPHIGHO2_12_FULL_65_19]|uniref:hypothetical protein n=1 Tax=Sphingopyxis sp. RIFCSPHIGHO2_12_FULL_65_19 TaxID=1802172 RepID=UPI0008CE7B15|nr:hypothetical protein [Sphingopyxis sp. RIFCSPHIGHO2_12_FULL_65_19]OHD09917.1 MAG: hypothetical protein A3E77_11780 [Sphingopyxis sp. RIFCSPHIGHO2_12_FULL_65_19]
MRYRLLFLAPLLFAAACTKLEVRPYSASDPKSGAGYAYMLDYTQYEVELKRSLLKCDAGEMPKIKAEATIGTTLVPDGEHVYVIDPNALISAFKTSDISVEYKDGRMTAFNASTVDKSGEVVKSIAVTAGKLAGLAAGFPIPVAAGANETQYCSAEAVDNLKLIETNKPLIEAATSQIDDARGQLTTLTAQFSAKPTEKLRKAIKAKTDAIEKAQKALDALTKASTKAQDWLTDKQTFRWPEQSTRFHEGPIKPIRPATIAKWFDGAQVRAGLLEAAPVALKNGKELRNDGPNGNIKLLGMEPAAFYAGFPMLTNGADISGCPAAGGPLCEQYEAMTARRIKPKYDSAFALPVSLHLVAIGSYGGETKDRPKGIATDGLRYRVPAAGAIYVCEGDEPCHLNGSDAEPIARVTSAIAQLGHVFNLPFSSPAFASGGVYANFDDQGRLTKAGLRRDNAAALDMAGAGGAIADQMLAYAKAKQEEPIADLNFATRLAKAQKDLADAEKALEKSPTEQLTDELALLDAQKKVADARKALGPNRVEDLTNAIQIAKLEVDLAEQQKRLEDDPNADQEEIREQYAAQTAVLNARKAQLEAEAAVLAAERALAAAQAAP